MFIILLVCSLFSYSVFGLSNYHLATEDGVRDSGDFQLVQEFVEKEPAQSPEDFLTYWKSQRPDYFSNYVLAYRSRSLQKSSPQNPRALIFNTNADLVLGFNGDQKHHGFDNIEMMRFNHDSKSFEFYEMSFYEGKAQLSKPNPKKCLVCHQSSERRNIDPRPNWEPYNVWPGFYGALDDNTEAFKDNYHTRKRFSETNDRLLLDEFDSEKAWFTDFVYAKGQHPRYSLLSAETTNQYGQSTTLNGDLTNRLAGLNFQRVARLIRTEYTELYPYVKWTLWGHVKCGGELYLPEDVFAWLYSQVPSDEYARKLKVASEYKSYDFALEAFGEEDVGKYFSTKELNTVKAKITDVMNVLFDAFGRSTEDWSMDFKTGRAGFAAFERFGVTNDPRPFWRESLKRELGEDPELINLSCAQIKEKSLSIFPNLEVAQKLQQELLATKEKTPERPLISDCISCHVTDHYGIIPFIPFHDEASLKQALTQGAYKRGSLLDEIIFRMGPHATESEQMPKGRVPSDQKRKALLNYLKSL